MGCDGPMSFLRDALWQLPFRASRRQPDQTAVRRNRLFSYMR